MMNGFEMMIERVTGVKIETVKQQAADLFKRFMALETRVTGDMETRLVALEGMVEALSVHTGMKDEAETRKGPEVALIASDKEAEGKPASEGE